jgi:predicted transcriptional regulator
MDENTKTVNDAVHTTNDLAEPVAAPPSEPAIPGIVTDPATPVDTSAAPESPPEPAPPVAPPTETPTLPPAQPSTEVTQPLAESAAPVSDENQLHPKAEEPVEAIPVPVPPPTPSPTANDIPPAVAALTDEELRIASVLYVKRHQKERSQKAVAARQATQKIHLDEILNYMSSHNPTKLINVAYACNVSPEQASHYLRVLRQQGKVTGEGHGPSRIFKLS